MADTEKKHEARPNKEWGATISAAMSGTNPIAKGDISSMTVEDVGDYNNGWISKLSPDQLTYLENNVQDEQLKKVIRQRQADNGIIERQNEAKSGAAVPTKNSDISSAMAGASKENRYDSAKDSMKADERLNGTAPGSDNKLTTAQGNADHDLSETEKLNVYGADLTDEDVKEVEDFKKAENDKLYGTDSTSGSTKAAGSGAGKASSGIPSESSEKSETSAEVIPGQTPTGNPEEEESVNDNDRENPLRKLYNEWVYGNSYGSVNEHEISDKRVKNAEDRMNSILEELNVAQTANKDPDKIARLKKQYEKAKTDYDELKRRQNAGTESARAKSAAEEKEKNASEFLKKNPSLMKAIFDKKSGLNMGERLALLGKALFAVGAGAAAGYAGKSSDGLLPKEAEIYNKAREENLKRKEGEFDAEQEAKNQQAKYLSAVQANPTLSGLSSDVQQKLAENLVTGLTREDFEKVINDAGEALTPDQMESAWNSFENTRKNNASITEQQSNVIDNATKNLDYTQKAILGNIQTTKEANETISSIDEMIQTLRKAKLDAYDCTQDKYWQYVNGYLGYRKGVQTAGSTSSASTSGSESKENTQNGKAGLSGSAQIPGIGKAGLDGGWSGSWSSGSQSAYQSATGSSGNVDVLVAANIPTAELKADEWNAKRQDYVDAYNAAIDQQIEYWEQMRESTRAQMEALKDRSNGTVKDSAIKDGIVKAPHMQQWIQREDGTKIHLHPDDNIYATLKTLTTPKDDGKNVVPMDKEDDVIFIQKKLGYDGKSPINKDFGYYLSKLRKE